MLKYEYTLKELEDAGIKVNKQFNTGLCLHCNNTGEEAFYRPVYTIEGLEDKPLGSWLVCYPEAAITQYLTYSSDPEKHEKKYIAKLSRFIMK